MKFTGKIADFKHQVVLCAMRDIVVATTGEMSLAREGVLASWAAIEPSQGSMFSAQQGVAVEQNRDVRTHKIWTRHRTDLDVSHTAWVYEQRRKSPPRWFKVLRVTDVAEDGRYTLLECRLVERSDNAAPPVAKAPECAPSVLDAPKQPEWVKL